MSDVPGQGFCDITMRNNETVVHIDRKVTWIVVLDEVSQLVKNEHEHDCSNWR